MSSMKALLQVGLAKSSEFKYGDPALFKVQTIARPTNPAPGNVIIKVYAAALNPADVKRSEIDLEPAGTTPVVGYDVAGVVESVGSGVENVCVGDRVFGDVLGDTLGPRKTGSIAEYTECAAHLVCKMPALMSMVEAAALPLVCQTAIQVLRAAKACSDDKLFVSAGSGGVGLHLMQIARGLFGISQVATTASKRSFDLVKKFGANLVVDYKTEDAGEVLKDWADIVFDTTMETEMEEKIGKENARLMSIVWVKNEKFQNILIQPTQQDQQIIADLCEQGKLNAVVDSVYSLDDAVEAVKKQTSGRAKGKVVIKVLDE